MLTSLVPMNQRCKYLWNKGNWFPEIICHWQFFFINSADSEGKLIHELLSNPIYLLNILRVELSNPENRFHVVVLFLFYQLDLIFVWN